MEQWWGSVNGPVGRPRHHVCNPVIPGRALARTRNPGGLTDNVSAFEFWIPGSACGGPGMTTREALHQREHPREAAGRVPYLGGADDEGRAARRHLAEIGDVL